MNSLLFVVVFVVAVSCSTSYYDPDIFFNGVRTYSDEQFNHLPTSSMVSVPLFENGVLYGVVTASDTMEWMYDADYGYLLTPQHKSGPDGKPVTMNIQFTAPIGMAGLWVFTHPVDHIHNSDDVLYVTFNDSTYHTFPFPSDFFPAFIGFSSSLIESVTITPHVSRYFYLLRLVSVLSKNVPIQLNKGILSLLLLS
jgi:hypothetical protein